MKMQAQSGDQEYTLQIRRDGTTVVADINGRKYQFELHQNANGNYLLTDGTQVYRCRVEAERDRTDHFTVYVCGRSFTTRIIDPKRLRSSQDSGGHHHGAAEITAAMPGKVVRVLVEVGASVEAGDGIVVVEAMKMQNEMKAPKTGTIIALSAKPGETVNPGTVLAVIE